MSTEDPGRIEVEHEAHDTVKQLKKDYIGKSSKNLCYANIQDEKEHNMEIKKMIQKLIRRGDENCLPIDFDAYKPSNF